MSLNLRNNNIGDAGCTALAGALKVCAWCLAAELASPALLCGLLLAREAPAVCFVVLGACMFAVPVPRFGVLYWCFCFGIPQLVRWVAGRENHLAAQVTAPVTLPHALRPCLWLAEQQHPDVTEPLRQWHRR